MSQFGYYIYPSQNVSISITQNSKTISKIIGNVEANSSIGIDIEENNPLPEQGKLDFYINGQKVTVEEWQTLSLPSTGGVVYASLENHMDLDLTHYYDWMRPNNNNSSIQNSTLRAAANTHLVDLNTPVKTLKFIASFSKEVIYQ